MKKDWFNSFGVQALFIAAVLVIWQICYMAGVFPKLLFPSLADIGRALVKGFSKDNLGAYTLYSLSLLARGLLIGAALAFVLSSLSMVSEVFRKVYNLVVSICDLIPGVALLPLAILWFGIGENTVIFIVVHGVIWPMSRSITEGFTGVSRIYVEAGKNFGLKGFSLISGVYIPAAFASMLSGLRTGWARAWRGLIAIEMIFGTTGSGAGIGWYIFIKRTNVDIAGVFASLLVIILIGVVVEYMIFRTIEKNTVEKWGMVH